MHLSILKNILSPLDITPGDLKHIDISGQDPILPSPFLIGEAGAAALSAVGYAAAELWKLRTGRLQQINIAVRDAAIAQRSANYLKVLDGKTEDLWSPFSGFYETKDQKFIQFHCNFPHHQQGVIDFLGCAADKSAVIEAVKYWDSQTLEDQLNQRGLCASILRSPQEWAAHPQAQAIKDLPLLEIIKIGESQPIKLPQGSKVLSGIKILDLTRVLAGPTCGKTLAELGGSVLRISSPNLPFILPLVMDTGFGKYAAHLDLDQEQDKIKLLDLVKTGDVFLQAYRPGGLAGKGFGPEDLAKIKPGIIYVELSAYSHQGPWAHRHGYDSLVQTATGIAYEQTQFFNQGSSQGYNQAKPQHLPAQSLDYLTGYLAAFAVLEALKRRAQEGGSYLIRLSLAQTGHWFSNLGRVSDELKIRQCQNPSADQIKDLLVQTKTPFGLLEHMAPVLKLSETPLEIGRGSVPLGSDPAAWPEA